MANRWNIPADLEREIRLRDSDCVYCRVAFVSPPVKRSTTPSWEHIVNDASIVTRDKIALCCCSCNSSKGQKLLQVWLAGPYCARRGIAVGTVAKVVKQALTPAP
jgi:hypothetical protein